MAEEFSSSQPPAGPPPIPDPQRLQPGGLSNRHKRRIFYGVMGLVLLLVLANLIGTPSPSPMKTPAQAGNNQPPQNPSPAQIRDWENNLKQEEARLLDETTHHAQQLQRDRAASQGGAPPVTADDLQRAAALREAAEARQQFQANYGGREGVRSQSAEPQKSQLETEQEQRAYKSLFADSVVRQDGAGNSTVAAAVPPQDPARQPVTLPPGRSLPERAPETAEPARKEAETARRPLDFEPAAQRNYWLPEGTVLEAVLTNRLDADQPGPVNCMITTDVYLPGSRQLVIPQGARVLGEASKVSAFGQQRLAVAFHRIIVPGPRTYSIPLDRKPPALAQAGEAGLHDKVKSHYVSIFGASLAVGAIGGLAQIGNGYSGFGYDPAVQLRNGVSQSLAQSSDRILDRFLNRLPTITIREGTRAKVVLTDDLEVPAYNPAHQAAM
jgi:type IV secretory pathway VirB10-like protein